MSAKQFYTVEGNRVMTEAEIEEFELEQEMKRVDEVEQLILEGKLKPFQVAKWRKDHPDPKAKAKAEAKSDGKGDK